MEPDDATVIDAALADIKARANRYALYSRYYEGNHDLTFASEKFRNAFGNKFSSLADNLCPSIVDATADRMTIEGFALDAEQRDNRVPEADVIWRDNRMDRRSGEVHNEALKAGDSYLVVWSPEPGRPILFPQRADMMTVRYDPDTPGRLRWAAKLWAQDDGKYRITLYYPDRIVKYVTKQRHTAGTPVTSKPFVPLDTPGEAWPLVNEWGEVPVFHFANNAGVGAFGTSELRDVIPLQDALNKSITDMLVAMEFVALPQRILTGFQVVIDPVTGKPENTPSSTDTFLAFAGDNVQAQQFPGADLSQFIRAQESFRKEIAVVSHTPVHFLTPSSSDWPSGEALKTAETPLVAKVEDRQVAFGNVWEDAMRLALRMAGKGLESPLSALWADATPRSDTERAARVQTLTSAGASLHGAARVAGYSEEEAQMLTAVAVDGLRQ